MVGLGVWRLVWPVDAGGAAVAGRETAEVGQGDAEEPKERVEVLPDDARSADPVRRADPERVPEYPASWAPEGLVETPKRPSWAFEAPFIRGFAVGAYLELPGLSYDRMFSEIRGLGATHVSLVVTWSQANVRAVSIGPHPTETMADDKLRELVESAHRNGLQVLLFPILNIERRRASEWRGRLAPSLPARWWVSYEGFILHYAALAESMGVAVYSVGSELLDLESEQVRWESLIGKVRGVYRGSLTYSANWDHFDGVTFWGALDLAGMTGYFELTEKVEPSLEELRHRWSEGAKVIAGYGERVGKPVVLTEVGYPSQVGAASHPWDYTRKKAPSGLAQYLAFRAMYEAYLDRSLEAGLKGGCGLGGVIVWNWYGYGGPEDGTYTLRGKPATAVMKRWFAGE